MSKPVCLPVIVTFISRFLGLLVTSSNFLQGEASMTQNIAHLCFVCFGFGFCCSRHVHEMAEENFKLRTPAGNVAPVEWAAGWRNYQSSFEANYVFSVG